MKPLNDPANSNDIRCNMDRSKVDPDEDDAVRDARRSLLKVVWEASGFAKKFSSKPLDMDGYFTGITGRGSFSEAPMSQADSNTNYRQSIFSASYLTVNEKIFLEELLQSEDHEAIQFASRRLADKILFPPIEDDLPGEDENDSSRAGYSSVIQSSTSEGNKVLGPIERDNMDSELLDRSFAADFESWIEEPLQEEESKAISGPTSNQFLILGLSTDTSLIHPRVLSPPLMEVSHHFVFTLKFHSLPNLTKYRFRRAFWRLYPKKYKSTAIFGSSIQ